MKKIVAIVIAAALLAGGAAIIGDRTGAAEAAGQEGQQVREETIDDTAEETIDLDGPTVVITGDAPAQKVWNAGGKAGNSIRAAQNSQTAGIVDAAGEAIQTAAIAATVTDEIQKATGEMIKAAQAEEALEAPREEETADKPEAAQEDKQEETQQEKPAEEAVEAAAAAQGQTIVASISHYCACSICNGKYSGVDENGTVYTLLADGTKAYNNGEEQRIIATTFGKIGQKVEIDGKIYTIRDRFGNTEGANKIDLFIADGHEACKELGVRRKVTVTLIG